jgi:hypothetical protein
LIKKIELKELDLLCNNGRTLILPVRQVIPPLTPFLCPILIELVLRYQTFTDAMDVCEELGDRGSFLAKFETFEEYVLFHEKAKQNKAVDTFCVHGGRYIFWLPYR